MDFIAQAFKGKTRWYHYFLGSLLAFFIMQFGGIPLVIVRNFTNAPKSIPSFLNPGINKNLFLLIALFPAVLGLLGLYVAIKKINRLPFLKILTARSKFDWKRVGFAFVIWMVLVLLFLAADFYIYPNHYVFNFKLIPFTFLVIVSVLFIPFQTSFEEIFFRGYLLQGFGTAFKSRLLALVITSTTFGLLHFANPEVSKIGNILLIEYVATGFLFGIITLMDDGIELTLGIHAANNIAAAIFVTTNWSVFQTDALFIDVSEPQVNLTMFLPIIVAYPLILLWLSRKYNWTDWKQKLTGIVQVPVKIIED